MRATGHASYLGALLLAAGSSCGRVGFEVVEGDPGSPDAALSDAASGGSGVELAWASRFGGTADDEGFAIAVDGAGNIYLTGWFEDSVDLGAGPVEGAGGMDLFLASFTPDGTHRWSVTGGDSGVDGGLGLAVGGDGHVHLAARFAGTVDLGGGPVTSAGGRDILLASFSSQGAHRWTWSFGDTGTDNGYDVSASPAGEVFAAGRFAGDVSFGGPTLSSAGSNDAFVAGLSPSGGLPSHQWSRQLGGAGSDLVRRVVLDSSGDLLVGGHFEGDADLGAGMVNGAGSDDVFLARWAADGSIRWTSHFGGPGGDEQRGLAFDAAGNLYLAGFTSGGIDFGGGVFPGAGGWDVFVASFDAGGAHRWSATYGAAGNDYAHDVAVDTAGNLYVVGTFSGTADFGGTPFASAGGTDIFVASYRPDGSHRWSLAVGGSGSDQGRGIAVDGMGRVTITGQFEDTLSQGGAPLSSAGGADVLLLQLVPR